MKINGITFAFHASDVLLGTPSLSLATNAVQVSGVSKVPWLIYQTSDPSFLFYDCIIQRVVLEFNVQKSR